MDLRQLEALRAIADHGSFSQAAEALHTVQSNVSTRISRLERELNAELVNRATRRLTPAGEAVLERARRIDAEIAAIPSDLAAEQNEVRGLVRGAFIASSSRWMVPLLLDALWETYPQVSLQVTEAPTNAIVPGVRSGIFDFGVISLPIEMSGLEAEYLYNETTELIVPFNHPLATATSLHLVDLADWALIIPPLNTPLRDDLERAYFDQRLEVQVLTEVNGVRLIEDLVRNGVGPAVLPTTLVAGDTGYVRVPISDAPLRRAAMIRNAQHAQTVPAEAVIDLIRSTVAASVDELDGVATGSGTS